MLFLLVLAALPPTWPPAPMVMSPVVLMAMGTLLLIPRKVPLTVSEVRPMWVPLARPGPSKLTVLPGGMVAVSARPFLMPGT
jgi:hypothetical protein